MNFKTSETTGPSLAPAPPQSAADSTLEVERPHGPRVLIRHEGAGVQLNFGELLAYAGLLVWTFFSNGVTSGTHSLVSNTNLVTKVYFPRAFIPAAAVGAGLVDLFIASVFLVGLAAYYGVRPTA